MQFKPKNSNKQIYFGDKLATTGDTKTPSCRQLKYSKLKI